MDRWVRLPLLVHALRRVLPALEPVQDHDGRVPLVPLRELPHDAQGTPLGRSVQLGRLVGAEHWLGPSRRVRQDDEPGRSVPLVPPPPFLPPFWRDSLQVPVHYRAVRSVPVSPVRLPLLPRLPRLRLLLTNRNHQVQAVRLRHCQPNRQHYRTNSVLLGSYLPKYCQVLSR
jgi:hypothetical protein